MQLDVPRNMDPKDTNLPWDLVIYPKGLNWSLRLREIWQYRGLLYQFVRRDLVTLYKQTILGPVWFFIQPLLTTVGYVLVFQEIAGLSTDGTPPVLFYLCGVTFWNYFADCLNKTASAFRDNASLFGKVYFPRIIVPLSIVLSNLAKLAIQFVLIAICMLWYGAKEGFALTVGLVAIPFIVGILALFSLALGMLFSSLTAKYRDLVFVLQFAIQLLMYATPVVYPFSEVPGGVAHYLMWNPLVPLFEAARFGLLGVGAFSIEGMLYAATVSIFALIASAAVFNRVERAFMDTV